MARSRLVALENLQQFTAINVLSDPGATGGPYIVPQCARIVITFSQESARGCHIVLVGRYAGAFHGTTAEATAIMTSLTTGAAWVALAAFLASNTSIFSVSIQDVAVPNAAPVTSTGSLVPGTSASPALPNEVAACLTKRTALIGVANRGRMFFPGFATNALGAGNVIAAATVTALNNWAATISGALQAQGYTHVIGQPARQAYMGSTGTSHPARAATSVAVTSVICRDNHWDSQRRRGLK